MKTSHIIMGMALLGAAGLVLFGDKTPASDVAEPVVRAKRAPVAATGAAAASTSAPASGAVRGNGKPAAEVSILRLVPRALLIGEAGEGAFASGDGVFGGQNWNPPPPPPPPQPKNPPPPPPPMAPPLPFSYIGKAAADGAWEVFLSRADKIYVVRTKAVIDGTYRVESIAPPLMTLTYLPLNQVQQINIGVLD
jgi:hypothetical protein